MDEAVGAAGSLVIAVVAMERVAIVDMPIMVGETRATTRLMVRGFTTNRVGLDDLDSGKPSGGTPGDIDVAIPIAIRLPRRPLVLPLILN